ncbi:hypothetical protein CTAYLR_009915 [Chrysophaeum taylorii]|uniref:Ndc10 domain-containing protein n=1 Tax=Chrysophaeum taylorii TaxID=2483200 RepID=A0AAD7XH27_9STRA|nr:hypothetical protein CTAYLR_009915 [Chrysophaeum taylorii]
MQRAVRVDTLEKRPKNTSKSYGTSEGEGTRWIKQFRTFVAAAPGSMLYGHHIDSDRKVYEDDLVTPEKSLEFLYFTSKRPKMDSNGNPIQGSRVETCTLKQMLKALVDLYKEQLTLENYMPRLLDQKIPSPRTNRFIPVVLANHAKEMSSRKRRKFINRDTEALQNGYNDEQHRMLCEYALFDGAPGPGGRNKLFRGTRARFEHVLQHALALRGDSLLKCQIADWLIFQTRSTEGPHVCWLLVFLHDNGTRNHAGHVDASAAMRHATNPERCLHFSMALYLFTMWIVLGVRKPNYVPYEGVDENDGQPIVVHEWMTDFLFFGNKPSGCPGKSRPPDPTAPLSNRTMLDDTKHMYEAIADPILDPEYVVCLRRRESFRMAETAGVSRDELREVEHHRQADVLSISNCNDFPMRFIRHNAGFPPQGGCFYVARSLEPVPDSLKKKVFGSVVNPVSAALGTDLFRNNSFDHTTRNHLQMIDYLAECLVQDAAFMRRQGKMDDHPMWGYEPFNTKEFADYAERQDTAIKNMPAERLRMTAAAAQERGDAQTAAAINKINTSLCDDCQKLDASADPSTTTAVWLANTPMRLLSEIHSQVCDATCHPEAPMGLADPSTTTAVRLANTPMRLLSEIHSQVCGATSRPEPPIAPAGSSIAQIGHAEPPATPPRRPATEDMAEDELMFGIRPLVVADSSTWDEDPLPKFASCYNLRPCESPQDVAQEYFRGVDGGPPVKELERFYGPKKRSGMGKDGKHSWRSNGTRKDERAFEKAFSRRAVIYEVLETKGEVDGVAFLNSLIKDQFPNSRKPERSHLLWLQKELSRQRPNYDKNRARGKKGRDGGPSKKQRHGDIPSTHNRPTNAVAAEDHDDDDDDLAT